MTGRFKPLRFAGTAVTVASFLFQFLPPLITFLAPPYDLDYKLFLVFVVYLPAAVFLIVLQARFLANAIHNLRLFETGITVEPQFAWLSAIPFVNFFVMPWLIYTVHERSMTLAPERNNTADRSGVLTLLWWGTFIAAFVIGALAEGQMRPDERFGQTLLASVVGMVSAALTKYLVGGITTAQETRAGIRASRAPAAAMPASPVEVPASAAEPPATPDAEARHEPLPPAPLLKSSSEARTSGPVAKEAVVEAGLLPGPEAEAPLRAPDAPAPQGKTRARPPRGAEEMAELLCPKCGAEFRVPKYMFGTVTCPTCINVFDAGLKREVPARAEDLPAASTDTQGYAERGRRKPSRELPLAVPAPEARAELPLIWNLAAAVFAVAAPIGTFVLASEWGDASDVAHIFDPEQLQRASAVRMLQGGTLALAISLLVTVLWGRYRGSELTAFEAFAIWLGCALTLSLAVGLLFNHYRWLALGGGPDRYFFGGLPFGLALAAATGLVLRRLWHR